MLSKKMTSKRLYKADGRIETLCIHGIWHITSIPRNIRQEDNWHQHVPCDGCCSGF